MYQQRKNSLPGRARTNTSIPPLYMASYSSDHSNVHQSPLAWGTELRVVEACMQLPSTLSDYLIMTKRYCAIAEDLTLAKPTSTLWKPTKD